MQLRADPTLRIRRLTRDALALALALVLSYLETLLPLGIFLPGLKLGLANLAIMYVFFAVGRADAAIISFLRVVLTSLLFGTVSSFLFSLAGAVLAFLTLLLLSLVSERMIGRLGISVASAAAHVIGQMLAACLLYGTGGLLSLLPWLLVGSVPLGLLNGMLLILLEAKLPRLRREVDA